MADADALLRRFNQLKSRRAALEDFWRQCFDYTYPLRGAGFAVGGTAGPIPEATLQAYAKSQTARIYDPTGTDCTRILASALVSGTVPSNSRWVGMTPDGVQDDEADEWSDEAADLMWKNIHGSNFDMVVYECMVDIVGAGWFAMFVDQLEEGGYQFEQWPLSNCWLAASKPAGAIDTVYRAVPMSAEQAVNTYGETMVSDQVREKAKKTPDEQVEFVQAIYPRAGPHGYRSETLPFASCHIEIGVNKIVRESGYHEMPVIVPRWMLVPGSVYPVGPVFDALPHIRSLNKIKEMDFASMDLAIAGMWIAEDDGVLNPRTVKVGPRKIIVANSVDSMKALKSGADFQIATMKADELQREIRRMMMADQLQPQDKPQMTATEVQVRVELIRQLLGPIYGRLQAEFLQPLVKRCFGLAYRAGVFGVPPDSLRRRSLTVSYSNPLARSQKLVDVAAMDRYETTLAQEAAIKGEDVLDNYDWDQAARERAELLGVPAKLIPDEADMQRAREERASQMQAQAASQMVAETAADVLGKQAARA